MPSRPYAARFPLIFHFACCFSSAHFVGTSLVKLAGGKLPGHDMIRISILYPNKPGARFDFPYYVEMHMPVSIRLLSAHAGFKGVSVEKGISSGQPGESVLYRAMCHFTFTTKEDFLAAFMPNAPQLQGD